MTPRLSARHAPVLSKRGGTARDVKDVAIIGAGPYGLSAAAHLKSLGIEPYVIGEPMAYWKNNMPAGMILRSKQEASNIDAPQKHLSLRAYQRQLRRRCPDPLGIEDFIGYGEWFQKQVAPDLDRRHVQNLQRRGEIFEIRLEDGERMLARMVVLALGIGPFRYRPEPFGKIARELAPHSSEFNDLAQLRGKRVAVLGKGQSALEYAAILNENGAEVQIVTRAPTIQYRPFAWRKHLFRKLTGGPLRPLSHLILPPTDLGDIRTARKMADPDKFRRQSAEIQEKLLNDCRRPIGAFWLEPRLKNVPMRTATTIVGVEMAGDGLQLSFSDGTSSGVDRVLLATGFRIDISEYRILDPALLNQIRRSPDGYPLLTASLETSVTGLYMAGVVGERTLGPTLRFVTGTSNASPRIANTIRRAL